jgi:hypothetical protein
MLLRKAGRRTRNLYLVTACLTCGSSWIEPPHDENEEPSLDLVLVPEHTPAACDEAQRARTYHGGVDRTLTECGPDALPLESGRVSDLSDKMRA